MSNTRLIHSRVYNPLRPSIFYKAGASDHAQHTTIRCAASDRCEAFAAGTCVALLDLSGCMHGEVQKEVGPTKRAKSVVDWCRQREEVKVEGVPLRDATTKLARIGDYVWVPYSIYMNSILSGKDGFHWRHQFVKVEDFTVERILHLVHARPYVGRYEDTSYQRDVVPSFVTHLFEVFPDLALAAAERSPRIREIFASITKVGRQALLRTIRPNVGLLRARKSDGAVWAWDGSTMSTTSQVPFTAFNATEVRLTPAPDATAIITDDAQVTPETVFVD